MTLPVALQLFSVRDDFSREPIETLKKIKRMGYDGVEPAGLYGMSTDYFRGVCDAIGLKIPSTHLHTSTIEAMSDADLAAWSAAGCRYITIPFVSEEELPGGDRFTRHLKSLKEVSKRVRAAGMELVYHNHAHEFQKVNGDCVLDTLFSVTSKEELKAEIDVAWATMEGLDVPSYLTRYAGRLPLVHLKDYVERKGGGYDFCPFGQGKVDAAGVLASAVSAGVEWLVVEQDSPKGNKTPLESVAANRRNIKRLGF